MRAESVNHKEKRAENCPSRKSEFSGHVSFVLLPFARLRLELDFFDPFKINSKRFLTFYLLKSQAL